MSLTLTVLGCGGSYAEPDNACSGYLVRSDTTTVVLDAGPGTFANLQRHVDPLTVDAFVLSHEHPDHWLDLPVVRNVYKYIHLRDHVALFGTAGTRVMADVVCHGELEPTFAWTTITDGSEVRVGDVDLRFGHTDHPVETLAIEASAGRASLLYSADTGPGWSPAAFGRVPTLALLEASLNDEQEGLAPHLSARQAAEAAGTVDAERLVVTHVVPGLAPDAQRARAAEVFGGPTDVARPNVTFPVTAATD